MQIYKKFLIKKCFMPPNFRPQKTKVYAPVCSIYLSTQYNSATNQSFPPYTMFFPTPKFRFSSYRNIFFLPSHQSIIFSDSTLLPLCFRLAFVITSPFLHSFLSFS